jgi:hypothetical protein
MLPSGAGVSKSSSLTRGQCLILASSGLWPSLDALLSVRGSRIQGPLDPRGCDALLQASFGFAPRGDRHVHCNHIVRAVHLIRVGG